MRKYDPFDPAVMADPLPYYHLPRDDVQAAFELVCRPVPERVKIAITAPGSP